MTHKPIDQIEVILKTVERCNINCSYCYFFNGGDLSYKKHPPYISKKTILDTANFLKNACIDHHCKSLQIDFHGGEPLMQKKNAFDEMCSTFQNIIGPYVDLKFAVQTNGMLINDDWIELLSKYNVAIGISLDGTKEMNDSARIDKRGRGTYDRVIKGVNKIHAAVKNNKIQKPGLLCVINPEYNPTTIYRHFVDELQFSSIDFLLPDFSHDAWYIEQQTSQFTLTDYSDYLCQIFDAWTKDNNPSIDIRILKSTMSALLGHEALLQGVGRDDSNAFLAFTIASNGDIQPDDTLRSASPSLMQTNLNVSKNSLHDFLNHQTTRLILEADKTLCDTCQQCEWVNACGGGFLVHRYSHKNQFNNPSSMCGALKNIIQHIARHLLNHGVELEQIKKSLR